MVTPESPSGRLAAPARDSSGAILPQPCVAPYGPPRSSRSFLLLAFLLPAAVLAIFVRIYFARTAPDPGAGLPPAYAMACRSCNRQFEMSPIAYRRALDRRADKSANRVRCLHCGAEDSAYRTDSGMPGLGPLNPDGQPASPPRLRRPG